MNSYLRFSRDYVKRRKLSAKVWGFTYSGEEVRRITEIYSVCGTDWCLPHGRRALHSARSVATQKDPSSHSHRYLPQEVKHNTVRKAKLKSII